MRSSGLTRCRTRLVKTNIFDSDWDVARPFTALGRTFAVLALIFCVATPFQNDLPSRWTFFCGGLGYSALLSVFATGFTLLPLRARTRAFIALFIGFGFSVLVPVVFLFVILHFRFPFSISLSILDVSIPPLLWVSWTFIAVMFAFACYGWYYRLTRSGEHASASRLVLPAIEQVELAAHRVLRGELAPWVQAITAEFAAERVTLCVFHHSAPSGWQAEFEEVVESEWDQALSSLAPGSTLCLELRFHPADAFTTPLGQPCLLYVSPWSGPAA